MQKIIRIKCFNRLTLLLSASALYVPSQRFICQLKYSSDTHLKWNLLTVKLNRGEKGEQNFHLQKPCAMKQLWRWPWRTKSGAAFPFSFLDYKMLYLWPKNDMWWVPVPFYWFSVLLILNQLSVRSKTCKKTDLSPNCYEDVRINNKKSNDTEIHRNIISVN